MSLDNLLPMYPVAHRRTGGLGFPKTNPPLAKSTLASPLIRGAANRPDLFRVPQALLASKSMRGSMTVYMRSPTRFMRSPRSEKKNSVPNITG